MIGQITICGGTDKAGSPEKIQSLQIKRGEALAVVGPTGSGKTQLISDIEQYTEAETLTGRRIIIQGQDEAHAASRNLVAQVSQNMNFVIDMTIEDFLRMHARIRSISEPQKIIDQVLDITNRLAGEPVTCQTNLTQLSGGQSRALMVADVTLISNAPIVLVDEIENAGINRLEALDFLKGRGKIILTVSHDPTLILMADKRVIMKNGGMELVCETTRSERLILQRLLHTEKMTTFLRDYLRSGNNVDFENNNEEELRIWQEYCCTAP